MRFEDFSFGRLRIDGTSYDHDVSVDRGRVRKRRKGPSKGFRSSYGHIPLSTEEEIPWNCGRLVIGTGAAGSLPVMDEVQQEARRRKVELVIAPTAEAIETLAEGMDDTNAILHVTC